MNDLISRQAKTIKIEKRTVSERLIIAKALIEDALQELSSAQSGQKKGKWRLADSQNPTDVTNGNYLYFCSNCFHADLHAKTQEVPYCWYCGAEMEDEDADNN